MLELVFHMRMLKLMGAHKACKFKSLYLVVAMMNVIDLLFAPFLSVRWGQTFPTNRGGVGGSGERKSSESYETAAFWRMEKA